MGWDEYKNAHPEYLILKLEGKREARTEGFKELYNMIRLHAMWMNNIEGKKTKHINDPKQFARFGWEQEQINWAEIDKLFDEKRFPKTLPKNIAKA